MEVKLELTNLTCRVCLENFDVSNSLFDVLEYDEKLELKEVLNRLINLEIDCINELKPTRICSVCTERLLGAYDFVCQAKKSELLLVEFLNSEEKDELDLCADSSTSPAECLEYLEDENQELEVLDEEFEIYFDDEHCNKLDGAPLLDTQNALDKTGTENIPSECEEVVEKELMQNTDEKPVESSQSKSLDSPDRKHVTNTKWHKCDQCHRKFAKSETLARHIKLAHTYAPAAEIAAAVAMVNNPPKQQVQCPNCPRTFVRAENMIRHVQLVHNVKDLVFEDSQKPKKTYVYKRGLCPYCGESFSQASLIVHIRRHTGETPYKCDSCSKGFPRRQDLMIHKRKHTGERPHVCPVCGKSFARPNKLTRHMRVHTGERPYKCTECERSFAQSNDLTIHLRRHTGEKPYKCSVCSECFISGTALRTHRKVKSHAADENEMEQDPYEKIRVNKRNLVIVEPTISSETSNIADDRFEEFIADDDDNT